MSEAGTETLACPGCGADQPQGVLAKSGLPIVRCGACNLLYTSPRLTAARRREMYELRDPRLRRKADEPRRPPQEALAACLERLEPYRGQRGRLLDVGCGMGSFLEAARGRGWEAVGLDLSEECCRRARERAGTEVLQGTLPRRARELAGGFDAVTMWHLLEHVEHPLDELHAARQVLRPGGALWIAVPDGRALTLKPTGVLPRLFYPGYRRRHYPAMPRIHLVHYTPATLERLLAQAGFEVLHTEAHPFSAGGPAKNAWRRMMNGVFARMGFPRDLALLAESRGERH